jgi:1-deoxy-D-xylulose-5-phosphate synthase
MSHSHAERLSHPIGLSHGESHAAVKSQAAAILPAIHGPADVQKLTVAQMQQLAAEVRERIIDVIAHKGGHFGAPLGAVDLTIALLHAFDVPRDKIVWDVGHQAYAWKILTGRNERFDTIRQYGGLSGFLKREESPCDVFGAGHASTSLSAALGIASARDHKGEDFRVAAVIGDGAMTGGMAYEAMNNAGLRKTRMLVILNDNEMSISNNVWVVHEMFRKAVTHPMYARMREGFVGFIKKISTDSFIHYAHRVEEAMKGLIVPGMFFEEMGFRYIGPVDGHDIGAMVETFEKIRDWNGPMLVHVITQKGKGYKFAENDPIKYHAAANMKIETGVMARSNGPPPFTKVFGNALVDLGHRDRRIVGITAAMDSGTGLDIFGKVFPERFYDVGIAEECAVTMAAGMATEGLRPVCAIYSTFLQRAIDQVIHDVAIQNLPVFFVLDRGGLVGADGATHHGVFDLTYLRMIPNMVVMAPRDEDTLIDMTLTGVEYTNGPIAMRYPRGAGRGATPSHVPKPLPIGTGEVLRRGQRVALIAIGRMVGEMERVADLLEADLGHPVTVVDARFVKPLDETLLSEVARSHDALFTAEDNVLAGGFGSAVNEALVRLQSPRMAHSFGVPDHFIEQGTPEELYREIGLLPGQMAQTIRSLLSSGSSDSADNSR